MKKKKRKLNKKGKLLIIFLSTLLIMSIFQILGTNKRRTSEIGTNTQVETKTSENAVKMQNTAHKDHDRLCGLESIICLDEKLDKISQQIKQIADEYQIDWKLAVAIARHETGNYTSRAFKELNNVGGNIVNGKLKEFQSLEEGIEYFVSNLKRNYVEKGLITIEQIQKKYAPIGAENDPNNLNQYWTSSVKKIYESLE